MGERAVSVRRIFWLPTIAMLGLFAAGCIAPGLARGGGHGGSVRGLGVHGLSIHRFGAFAFRSAPFGRVPPALIRSYLEPWVAPRRFSIGNDLLRRGGDRFEYGWPIAIWPFWPSFDATPMVVTPSGSDGPMSPAVIGVSGSPNDAPERTASATLPDYSYVTGCHAIPNGYHCDVHHDSAAH